MASVSIQTGPSGRPRVMWRELDGTQRQQTVRTRENAKRIKRAIEDRLAAEARGVAPAPDAWTMIELHDDWLVTAKATLAVKTRESYAACWKHLEPLVGTQLVGALDGAACIELADTLNRNGLGKPTQAKTLALLSALLRHAIMRRQIPAHPMRGVVRMPQPRRQRVVQPPGPEGVWLLAETLRAREDPSGRVLVLLMGFAGLRPAEALALDWRDVGKRTLNVAKVVVYGQVEQRTKTRRARTVDLFPALEAELVQWRLEQGLPARGPVLGSTWNDDAYRNWRRRSYGPAAAATGVTTRPYDLRHGFASLLIAERRSILDVAAQLGQTPALCVDVYGHVIRELDTGRKVNAARAIERARRSVVGVVLAADDPGKVDE